MRRLIVAIALLAAACGGAGAETNNTVSSTSTTVTSPTSTTSSTSTTTTTSPSTTTTSLPESIPLPRSRLRAGVTYTGSLDIAGLDFELTPDLENWRVVGRGDTGRFVRFENTSATPGADLLLMAWQFESEPAAVLASILESEEVGDATEISDGFVAQLPTKSVDIWVPPVGSVPCAQAIPVVADASGGSIGSASTEWILACTWGRVWAIDVNGVTITIVGTANDQSLDPESPRLIEEFEPLLDDFINAITFCTEATPCDD